MVSNAMNAKLNEQITSEFFASQIYLAMSCEFDELGLTVLSKFFRKQSEEEREHGLKILDYLLEVEAKVELAPVPAPPAGYSKVLAAFQAALDHEQKVTRQIHELVALAEQEKDYATRSFLKWFVDEQVEELSTMKRLVQWARMAGDNLLQLENRLRHAEMEEA